MRFSSLEWYVIFLSINFTFILLIAIFTSCSSSWVERLLLEKRNDEKPCMAVLRVIANLVMIISKPLAQMSDWYSDIALLIEMSNFWNCAQNYFYAGISLLLLHQFGSALWTYFATVEPALIDPILHILNLRMFKDVYESAERGRPIYELRLTRTLEAVLESFPQLMIQLIFIIKCSSSGLSQLVTIEIISLFFSVYTIASVVVYEDVYGINVTFPYDIVLCGYKIYTVTVRLKQVLVKIFLIIIRMIEIWVRVLLAALMFVYIHPSTSVYYGICYIAYLGNILHTVNSGFSNALLRGLVGMMATDFVAPTPFVFMKFLDLMIPAILLLTSPKREARDHLLWLVLFPLSVSIFMVGIIWFLGCYAFAQYRAGRGNNVQELLKSQSIDIIFLLLQRKEIQILPPDVFQMTSFQIREVSQYGYSIRDFISSGYTLSYIKECFLNAGYGIVESKDAEFSPNQLACDAKKKASCVGFSATELKNVGYDDFKLRELGLYNNTAWTDLTVEENSIQHWFRDSLQRLQNAQEMMVVNGLINESIANNCIDLENEIKHDFKELFKKHPNLALDIAKTHHILADCLNSYLQSEL